MDNLTLMQSIKRDIMVNLGYNNDQAVVYIAQLMDRSPATVYRWLSYGAPKQALELLKLKLM